MKHVSSFQLKVLKTVGVGQPSLYISPSFGTSNCSVADPPPGGRIGKKGVLVQDFLCAPLVPERMAVQGQQRNRVTSRRGLTEYTTTTLLAVAVGFELGVKVHKTPPSPKRRERELAKFDEKSRSTGHAEIYDMSDKKPRHM